MNDRDDINDSFDESDDLDPIAALAAMGTDVTIFTTLWLGSHWHDTPFVEEAWPAPRAAIW